MHTIAVFALKGGVGKSALTVFLADFLSSVFDQRVLVVDLDPQQSSTIALLGEERLLKAIGRRATLGHLLMDNLKGVPRAANVLAYTVERPMIKERSRYKYLQAISVLASDRESWHDLDDRLSREPNSRKSMELLRHSLDFVQDQFDICLIDFSASYTGPITQNGLVASDWWLFPIEPNRMAARDIDGPRRALRMIWQLTSRKMKGLGTVLSRCQTRLSNEYRRTRAALTRIAEHKRIPKPFSKDAEIGFSVDALNALDDTLRDSYKTIDQKYGGPAKPLHQGIRTLTREILDRLRIPVFESADVETAEDVNAEVTKVFQKA